MTTLTTTLLWCLTVKNNNIVYMVIGNPFEKSVLGYLCVRTPPESHSEVKMSGIPGHRVYTVMTVYWIYS